MPRAELVANHVNELYVHVMSSKNIFITLNN